MTITEPVRAAVSPRWHVVLHPDVLACPLESHCGRVIRGLCDCADALLALVHEPDTVNRIQDAVRRETDVVWFG
jgi:hypothetical protein